MSLPTLFSDVAAQPFVAKGEPQALVPLRAIASIPAVTVVATDIGMIRFQKGFAPTHLVVFSDDLDTSTNVTIDVGYLYDDDTTFTEDPNAIFSALDIAQDAGSRVWPVDDGLLPGSFIAEGDGYLSITTGGGSTTTLGNISLVCMFGYNLTPVEA